MGGGYSHDPKATNGTQALAAIIRQMSARMDAIERRITGLGIQIDPTTGELVVPSGRSINLLGGDLIANGGNVESGNFVAGSAGWRAGSDGNLEVNDITLRDRIIGNDALTNPLTADTRFAATSNFSLAAHDPNVSVGAVRLSVVFTVPAGFTSAVLDINVRDGARNSTAALDNLWSYVEVTGPGGFFDFAYSPDAPAGNYTASSAAGSGVLTGLSGGDTITINSRPSSNNATWSADVGNSTSLVATCLFLR
jgi:hypothetical protein